MKNESQTNATPGMTIQNIKAEKQKRFDKLIKEVGMFFAFSNEQFAEHKTPLDDGDKYVSIGADGYMPKSKVDQYLEGAEEISEWYRVSVKEHNLREKEIAYELHNHEAFYTNSITDTLDALGSDYTKEEVAEVFRSEKQTYDWDKH